MLHSLSSRGSHFTEEDLIHYVLTGKLTSGGQTLDTRTGVQRPKEGLNADVADAAAERALSAATHYEVIVCLPLLSPYDKSLNGCWV